MAGWLPIIFIGGLVIYSYYVYVVAFCINTLIYGYTDNYIVKATLYLVFYHLLLIMVVVGYGLVAAAKPDSPLDFHLEVAKKPSDPVGIIAPLAGDTRPRFRLPATTARICGICNTPKPARCHHCSQCRRCILKMDHHCVWFNNCIGFGNYKQFVQTLFYAALLCLFVFGTLLQELIYELASNQLTGKSVQFLVICFFALTLGISSCMLLGYHIYLLTHNMTTIEHMDLSEGGLRTGRIVYDLGCSKNVRQVMGSKWLGWIFYTRAPDSMRGLVFTTRPMSDSV